MDDETRERFERIERILELNATQQAHNSLEIAELKEQVAEYRRDLSDELQLWSQMRQAMAEQSRQIQELRGELAGHADDPEAHE